MAGSLVKCPYCAEEIQADAQKCRYCGEWLTQAPTSRPGTGAVSRGSADARAVAKGMKEYEAQKQTSGCLVGLVLVVAVALGIWIHWIAGVVVFIAGLAAVSKWYYQE